MKTLFAIAIACFSVATIAQEKPDYQSIAEKVVGQSLAVKSGEVVIVSGTPAELELIEALVVEIAKAGGHYSIDLELPTADHRVLLETPVEYLQMLNPYPLFQARVADCYIYAASLQDPTLFSDVPEEKLAAIRSKNMVLREAFKRVKNRAVYIGQTGGIPSESYAELVGMNYADMLDNFWKGIDTDYELMRVDGEVLKNYLKPGSVIRVSSKEGTSLTFKLASLDARTNCGNCSQINTEGGMTATWLPAGEVYSCVDPTSANGVLVIPHHFYLGEVITNLTISFENGLISNLTGEGNIDKLVEAINSNVITNNCLSLVDIGINRDRTYAKGSPYASWEMAGMLTFFLTSALGHLKIF
jgi:aminopeptidase